MLEEDALAMALISAMYRLAWARWLIPAFPIAQNQNPASEGPRRSAAMARAGPSARFGSYFGGCFSIYRTSSMPAFRPRLL